MTPSWETLLHEESLAALLPAEYGYLARPIRDSLIRFLRGLGQAEQLAILKAQAELPAKATLAVRLGRLAQSCPVLHKLGQVLARETRLDVTLRQQFRKLESMPPSVSPESIRETLESELGPLDQRGIRLASSAIAEASVAVVIPFSRKGDTKAGQHVFKVLKPNIEQRLEQELKLLDEVGEYLDARCDELRIPHLDYQESFQQVQQKLREEIDLEHEQRHLREAGRLFADESRVHIPRLLPYCSRRITSMERVFGRQVTDHPDTCRRKRRRLARLIAEILIAQPVFSKTRLSMFHADPHAGNLWLTNEGRLAILDWSLVGRLSDDQRVAIGQILLGAITLDAHRVARLLADMAVDGKKTDQKSLRRIACRWVRRVRYGTFPGLAWLTGLLDDATQHGGLRVSSDLMLFRKSLLTLQGVVHDVGDTSGLIDATVAFEFIRRFAVEWPGRWVQRPFSRDNSTHLSNFDLTQTMLSYPLAAARFWAGYATDLVDAFAATVPGGSAGTRRRHGR